MIMPEATAFATSVGDTAMSYTGTASHTNGVNDSSSAVPTSMYLRSANDSLMTSQQPCTSTSMTVSTNQPAVKATKTANQQSGVAGGPNDNSVVCAMCKYKIVDKYLLEAVGKYWHEDCLRCVACQCRLGELGSTLYLKQNMILCRRDYLRLFGPTGLCAACHKNIPAFEMVMRARNNVYHLECFACQECNHRFCVGDQFYLCDNKILCQYDYNERMVFAQMFNSNYNNLAQLKDHINKQVDNLDEVQPQKTTKSQKVTPVIRFQQQN